MVDIGKNTGTASKVAGSLVDVFSTNIAPLHRRFPAVTVTLALLILVYYGQSSLWHWTANGVLWPIDMCENVFLLTLAGQVWRPFVSWLPHVDTEHVLVDVVYLLVAGTVFEATFGSRKMLVVFLAANWSGSWATTFWDPHYLSLVGSSDGTHGLVAYYCLWEVFAGRPHRLLSIGWLGIYVYLWYMAIYSYILATMPWPFEESANGGVDHLGGIVLASAWACYDVVHQRTHKGGSAGARV